MREKYQDLPYRRGVGVMVLNATGHVFVARRIDMISEAWQMPQGGIDEGEDPERAAFRELEEETGLKANQVHLIARSRGWLRYDLPDDLIPMLWKGKFRGQEQQWFVMRLTADENAINIETEHPEFSEWQWVPLEQIVDMIVSFKQPLYQQLVDEFGDYAVPASLAAKEA